MKENDKSIIIKGAYGQPNLGDDILMIVIDNLLKELCEDYYFLLPINSKGYAERYISNYLYNDTLLKTSILIYGGGTQFYQFKNTVKNARIKLLKKILLKPSFILSYIINKRKNVNQIIAKKKIAVGLGIGPFLKGNTKKLEQIEKSLSQFDLIITRDISSFNFAKRINSMTLLGSDLCFVNDKYLPFKIKIKSTKTSNNITLIVRDWDHSKDTIYIDSLIKYIVNNKSFKFKVVLFGNDNYCEKIFLKNKIDHIKWDPLRYTIQEFLDTIFDAELVISSRYHGCVLSCLYNVPFIPISIDPKLSLFSHEIYGVDKEWCFPYRKIDLTNLIVDFMSNKVKYKETILNSSGILVRRNSEVLNIFNKFVFDEKYNKD